MNWIASFLNIFFRYVLFHIIEYFWSPLPFLFQAVQTETFIKDSEARITKLSAELVDWQKMIPYEQMTMDEMVEAFPEEVSWPVCVCVATY